MFLKNKNIIFEIRRSKVTDYAALNIANLPIIQSIQGILMCYSDGAYAQYGQCFICSFTSRESDFLMTRLA